MLGTSSSHSRRFLLAALLILVIGALFFFWPDREFDSATFAPPATEIERAGGGEYDNARSAAELNEVVAKKKELEPVVAAPEQRDTRKFAAAGKAAEPGSFFHDAPLVGPGEYKGQLATMTGNYYQVPVRKGQELRAIGQIQKTKYETDEYHKTQAFSVTIYDKYLTVVAREGVAVSGFPSTPATIRAVWTAEEDTLAYVAIAASDNYGERSVMEFAGALTPTPAPYTLRLRLSGDTSEPGDVGPLVPRAQVQPGSGFGQAGELPVPGLATTDLKLGEVVFYRFPVSKGDVVQVSMAGRKPWWGNVGNYFAEHDNQATYTLTLYDDDQVQVAEKKVVVNFNPPDAHTASITWPVELSGHAYVSVGCVNTGHYITDNYEPKPGRLAVQVTYPLARGEASGKRGSDDPFAGAEADK